MSQIEKILALIAAVGQVAGGAGVPLAGLIAELAGILNRLLVTEQARTGMTRAQYFEATGIALDKDIADLLDDLAAGV